MGLRVWGQGLTIVKKKINRGKDQSIKPKRQAKTEFTANFLEVKNDNEYIEDREDKLWSNMISSEETNPLPNKTSQHVHELLTVKTNSRASSTIPVKGNSKIMNVVDRVLKTCRKCDIANKMKFKLKKVVIFITFQSQSCFYS